MLPQLFVRLPETLVHDIVYSDLDCDIKKHDALITLMYRDSEAHGLWTNELFPYKMEFMSENRGTVYERQADTGTYNVVCLPLEKFWNHDHPLSHRFPDTFNERTEVQIKHDGFIIKVYNYKGQWHVSTNSEVDASKVK